MVVDEVGLDSRTQVVRWHVIVQKRLNLGINEALHHAYQMPESVMRR